jgi:hypothetical protein
MHACELVGRLDAGLGAPGFEGTGLRVVVEPACTGERCDIDRSRSRFQEGLRRGASGSTGGENVVDDQDVLARDGGWIGDPEGTANVVAALAGRESRLAFGGAQSHERSRRKREMPVGMRFAQNVDGALCEGSGLVEAALSVLGAVQWYGNDEQFGGRIGCKLSDGGSENDAKRAGSGMDAVVLQRMDGGAHAAIIGSERDSACKGRRREAAGAAKMRGGISFDCGLVEGVTTTLAHGAVMDGNFSPAGITNWNGREMRQQGAAESTGGGKEG